MGMNWIDKLCKLTEQMAEAGVFDDLESWEDDGPIDHDAQAAMDGG
jgi:hypothetical protein